MNGQERRKPKRINYSLETERQFTGERRLKLRSGDLAARTAFVPARPRPARPKRGTRSPGAPNIARAVAVSFNEMEELSTTRAKPLLFGVLHRAAVSDVALIGRRVVDRHHR